MSELIFTNNGTHRNASYTIPEYMKGKQITFNGTLEENKPQTGGNIESVSALFKGLAVPAGLFYIQQSATKKPISDTIKVIKHDVIGDTLYDELLSMVTPNERKKHHNKTQKRNKGNKRNKRTRRTK